MRRHEVTRPLPTDTNGQTSTPTHTFRTRENRPFGGQTAGRKATHDGGPADDANLKLNPQGSIFNKTVAFAAKHGAQDTMPY